MDSVALLVQGAQDLCVLLVSLGCCDELKARTVPSVVSTIMKVRPEIV